ncbi:MAG: CmcJ/NvfI family oxidoreductase [Oceanisphaera sp.]|uniref:CmcJ/NvfI family oxidoreductase n=1 Tax=Oceanisphaera sp. TaxID=1929979 RepID=UPI003C77E753
MTTTSSTKTSTMKTSGQIESELNYIKPESTLDPEVFYSGGAVPQKYNDAYAFMPATIDDARSSQETFSVHKQGFQLVTTPTKHKDFIDEKAIEASYYDEVIAIVKEATGVKDVFVFDHTVRRGSANSSRKPAHHVHNDYTEQTAQSRAQERIGVEQFAKLKGRRMIQINVWRPLVDIVKRSPLAFCNAASVNQKDLLLSKIHFPDTDHVGEIYALRKAAEQKWVYFSEMNHAEVVLIKGFDSVKDGVARFTPHTAFEYPDQDPNVGARASIEVRTFAFY